MINEAQNVLIENEGALFRGFALSFPEEIWDFKAGAWKPFEGDTPKREGWGTELTPEEFEATKAELAACRAGDEAWEAAFEAIHGSDGEYQGCPAADAAYAAAYEAVMAAHGHDGRSPQRV